MGQSQIVSGKKLGRTIGIPTCKIDSKGNLELSETTLRDHGLIPGVYSAVCRLKEPLKFAELSPFFGKVLSCHNRT